MNTLAIKVIGIGGAGADFVEQLMSGWRCSVRPSGCAYQCRRLETVALHAKGLARAPSGCEAWARLAIRIWAGLWLKKKPRSSKRSVREPI